MKVPRHRNRAANRNQGRVWTTEAVRQHGMTTDIEAAPNIFGIGRTLAYDLLLAGEFQ